MHLLSGRCTGLEKSTRTGKTGPVLVDFPLHLISQDCHMASPNCKGGRELKCLERGVVLAHDWPKPQGGHVTAWPRRKGDSCRVGEAARGIICTMGRRKGCCERSLKEEFFKVLGIMAGTPPQPITPLSASLILFYRRLLTVCLQLWAVAPVSGACSVSVSPLSSIAPGT